MGLSAFIRNFYKERGYTDEQLDKMSPPEYIPYDCDGDYMKQFYDIITKDGTEHLEMWPNAGCFWVNGERLPITEISKWRVSNKSKCKNDPQ
jgi:hypothetical protein